MAWFASLTYGIAALMTAAAAVLVLFYTRDFFIHERPLAWRGVAAGIGVTAAGLLVVPFTGDTLLPALVLAAGALVVAGSFIQAHRRSAGGIL